MSTNLERDLAYRREHHLTRRHDWSEKRVGYGMFQCGVCACFTGYKGTIQNKQDDCFLRSQVWNVIMPEKPIECSEHWSGEVSYILEHVTYLGEAPKDNFFYEDGRWQRAQHYRHKYQGRIYLNGTCAGFWVQYLL